MPERIQLKRTKGWRKPENTVVVARPSKWGNPTEIQPYENYWRTVRYGPKVSFTQIRTVEIHCFDTKIEAVLSAIDDYESRLRDKARAEIKRELKGKNLACWCPLDYPCHADVLLRIANEDAE